MPELPEVERARQALEGALDREIRSVGDTEERCAVLGLLVLGAVPVR